MISFILVHRLHSRLGRWLTAASIVICLSSPSVLTAAFHLWNVDEIYSSADGSVQYIKLVALGGGQQFVGTFGATVTAANSRTMNTFQFPADLPGDTFNKVCILGTSNLASIPGGLTPDYFIPPNFILPAVGGQSASVTFDASGLRLAYTSLPSDGDLALRNSGGTGVPGTNSPVNFKGDADTIVPVRFVSSARVGTNFVMTFRTATGINGSAGRTYTVEFKNSLAATGWSPLTSVPGNGAVHSVSNALVSAPQRFFRLNVP